MRVRVYAAPGYAVFIDPIAVEAMVRAADEAHPHETIGPLFGEYREGSSTNVLDTAVVLEALVAVKHSARAECEPDGDLMWQMEQQRWPKTYYLGTWHSHPGGSPAPSPQDIATMRANATSTNCPEPVMIIIGGKPGARTWSVHVVNATAVHPLKFVETPSE